ncbi:hypothetical protein V1277_002539 [Bradyrhizobium sp. AZCC 1588]|uniref:hypothetical protein n=1 Tax=Bradyrhizobium sp. AZCC 1588 TaxID=3117018 RepID=UPI002FEFEB57
MRIDLDRLLAILEPRFNGFWIFQIEQSRKIGNPIRADDRLEFNWSRLINQSLHGGRADWLADICGLRRMGRLRACRKRRDGKGANEKQSRLTEHDVFLISAAAFALDG